jgi:hypothetical protein
LLINTVELSQASRSVDDLVLHEISAISITTLQGAGCLGREGRMAGVIELLSEILLGA